MRKTSILAVAALAMFSCSKNVGVNPDVPVTGDQISFKSTVTSLEKGTYTALDGEAVSVIDGDKFGVFMYTDGTVTANNVEFTYDATNDIFNTNYGATPGSSLTWETVINGPITTGVNFHSYYPFNAASTDATNVSFTIPTAQTMGEKDATGAYTTQRTVTASDFLYSKNIDGVTAENGKTINFASSSDVPADRTVRFTYAHALAMVEFNILNSAGIVASAQPHSWFVSLELSGNTVWDGITMDLTADNTTAGATINASSNTATFTMNQASKDATHANDKLVNEVDKTNSKAIYQMLVAPMATTTDLADAKVKLVVKRGNNASYSNAANQNKNFESSFPIGTVWESGKHYKYNIIVAENTIRVDLVEIEDWIPEEGGDLVAPPTL